MVRLKKRPFLVRLWYSYKALRLRLGIVESFRSAWKISRICK